MVLQQVHDRDAERKQQAKDYADTRYHAKNRAIDVGDAVLLGKRRENKFSLSYESQPYKVTARYGGQVVLKSPQGVKYKRNLQHVKPLLTDSDMEGSTESEPNTPGHAPIPESVEPPVEEKEPPEGTVMSTPRPSGRVSHPPEP